MMMTPVKILIILFSSILTILELELQKKKKKKITNFSLRLYDSHIEFDNYLPS